VPSNPPSPSWDAALADVVRRKARQLVGKTGLTAQDLPDLEGDLALDLVARMADYDPARADRDRFVRMVIARAAAKLLRHRRAARRDTRRVVPLESDPVDPASDVSPLRLDVADAVAALPPELRAVAVRLARAPVAAVARQCGVSRDTIYSRVRAIRRHFEGRGLRDYLPTL
jgi:hypothetical protein